MQGEIVKENRGGTARSLYWPRLKLKPFEFNTLKAVIHCFRGRDTSALSNRRWAGGVTGAMKGHPPQAGETGGGRPNFLELPVLERRFEGRAPTAR